MKNAKGKFPNLLGRLDTLNVEVSAGGNQNLEGSLNWSFPRLFKPWLGLGFGLHHQKSSFVKDSSHSLLTKGFQVSLLSNGPHSLQYDLAWRDIIPQKQNYSEREPAKVGPSETILRLAKPSIKSALTYQFQSRLKSNLAPFPQSSGYFNFLLSLAGLGGDTAHVKSQASWSDRYPLFSWLSLVTSISFGGIVPLNGSETPLADRFFLRDSYLSGVEVGPRRQSDLLGGDVSILTKTSLEADLPFLDEFGIKLHAVGVAANLEPLAVVKKSPARLLQSGVFVIGVGFKIPSPLGNIELDLISQHNKCEPSLHFGLSTDV